MVQVLPTIPRKPSFSQRLSQGLGKGLEMGSQLMQQHQNQQKMQQENQQLSQLTGMDFSSIPPELRQKAFEFAMQRDMEKQKSQTSFDNASKLQEQKYGFENEAKASKLRGEQQEKLAPFQAGLDTIQQMRKLKGKGNLGVYSKAKGIFDEQTRKDRAQYTQLGKSLISLASTIPIRNKAEFETLAHDLYDPSNSDATNEGILNAMEEIIKRNMSQYQGSEQNQPMQAQQGQKPPLSSFREQ